MSSLNCSPQALADAAACIDCGIPPGMQMPVLISLLCQIANASGGGGGGSGTVTSFSAGNLAPLFTTAVATATTTPALSFTLSTQTANTLFAGPVSGGAAAPTFRAMVNADIPTTLTPQVTRLGIGTAADGTSQLFCLAPSSGAGVQVNVMRVDATTSDPRIILGVPGAGTCGYIQYLKGSNILELGPLGSAGLTLDGGGNLNLPGPGVYVYAGNVGFSGTFDATNTVTVSGGIVTGVA